MTQNSKYKCPCCESKTLENQPPGTFEICPVCFWEDDAIQYENPLYKGGANNVSLDCARKNYKMFGASEECYLDSVRTPIDDELC